VESRVSTRSYSSPGDRNAPDEVARTRVPASNDAVSPDEVEAARERAREALFGTDEAPRTVGRYTLLQPLGTGGMGTVFAAYDPKLDRRIALKVVRPHRDPTRNEIHRRRMESEARAMAKVSHPNVATVYEVGAFQHGTDTLVFVAMEFVDGRTLRDWVAVTRPDHEAVLNAYVAAGRGLAAVHRVGLVHRDFKPDNVMIDGEGRVKVLDFGLARGIVGVDSPPSSGASSLLTDAAQPSDLTRTGALVGTPAYMAPEQIEGEPADARTDQYSFCVALYEALWKRRPFEASTVQALAAALLEAERAPDPPRSNVPARVRHAVLRALSRRPEDRFATMDALLAALAPRAAPRRIAGWVAASVGLGAGAWMAFAAPATPCPDNDAGFPDVWSPERAQTLRSAFVATALPYAEDAARRVDEALSAYGVAWRREVHRSCMASRVEGTQSDARFERRARCLERRRREASAVTERLLDADTSVVEHATDAVERLVAPAVCDDDRYLDATAEPPADPEIAAQVQALEVRIDEAEALDELGHDRHALEQLEAILPEAEATAHAPLVARARIARARMEWAVRDVEAAHAELTAGYFGARSAASAEHSAIAALELASFYASVRGDVPWAAHWLALAETEIDRHGLDDLRLDHLEIGRLIANLQGDPVRGLGLAEQALTLAISRCTDVCQPSSQHESLSLQYTELSRFDEAVEHARLAVDYARARRGAQHPRTAAARGQLGAALTDLGRLEEAVVELQASLAIREASLDAGHPNIATARVRLGGALAQLGRVDEAIAQLERARDAFRAADIPVLLAGTLNELANAYDAAGRAPDARRAYVEAIEGLTRIHPEGHPSVAAVMSNLATLDSREGRNEEALAAFRGALEMRRRHVTGPDPQVALFQQNIGGTLMDLGRRTEAIEALREAVELTREGTLTEVGVNARLRLADLLWTSDPTASGAMVSEAKARCDALEPGSRTHVGCEKVAAWLGRHP
jgi:eukaryotic-like serine/threonine-protein kinase